MVFFGGGNGGSGNVTGDCLPVLSGNGAPGETLGVVGQVYIDLTNEVFYGPKTSTGWGDGLPFGGTLSDHNHTISQVTGLQSQLDTFATSANLSANISAIIDGAPESLNTLNELAAAIADDPNFSATISAELAGKAPTLHNHQISDVQNLQSVLDGLSGGEITLTMDGLTDVNLSGLTSGQHLQYNGTTWLPVTIDTATEEEPATPPTDLTMIQNVEGLQTFLWNGNAESGFEVELVELSDAVIDIEDSSTITTESDGSITLVAELDATYLDGVVISATNNFVDWEQAFYEEVAASSSNITVTGVYLPEEFAAPGDYTLALTLLDLDDQVRADTGPTINVTVTSHGSPVAPAVETVRWTDGILSVGVTAITNPHMNGFYGLDEITYYLETAEDQDAGPWARSSALPANSTGTTEFNVEGLSISAPLWVRIVAVNPLGEGVPTRVREL